MQVQGVGLNAQVVGVSPPLAGGWDYLLDEME